MKLKYALSLTTAFCLTIVPQALMAQTVPNLGNYQDLNGNFRIGIQATNAINGFSLSRSFEQDTIDEIIDFLDPTEIALVIGQLNAQSAEISQVFDLRGATALAGYQQNGTTLSISFVSPSGDLVSLDDGTSCSFTFQGITRQDAFNQFDTILDDGNNATARQVYSCLGRSFTRFSPIDPLAGNPNSLQASLARSALDLTSSDSLIEEGTNTYGDPWIIGAAATTGSAGRFDYQRVDARVQRGFRVFAGNRALLKFDLPVSYSNIKGAASYTAQVGLGVEVPLIDTKWSIEPRVSYGVVYSDNAGSVGHILQGSVVSRYVVQGLGRGRLVIGNMVAYSSTLATPGDYNLNPDIKNWVFRNGLAYELPLKGGVGGRSSSLRASYAHTLFAGDKLFNRSFHEATISFGLRGREESVRAARDLIRFNLNTVQANGYQSYTAGIGFRF
ncbi:hypothetical protein [Parasphingorhabdus sp.]|uniref:hypothetical protein n=1 Tax=Parasphingorhabdus sp. TaxID=2709688 RepID=UPI003592FBC6